MFVLKIAAVAVGAVTCLSGAVYACVCLAVRPSKPCADPSQHPLVRDREEVR